MKIFRLISNICKSSLSRTLFVSQLFSISSFTIEPLYTDCLDIEHFRVSIAFRNAKGRSQQVYWIVKVVQDGGEVAKLNHEIRVYTELLTEIGKFLANKRNQRARYLLNVPDLIYHERQQGQGKILIYCPTLFLKGLSFKPSGNCIVAPNLCFFN